MEAIWTHGGKFFGYRHGNSLFTYQGLEVGRFDGDVIYGRDGRYLGEVMGGRLISHRGKGSWRGYSFSPSRIGGATKYANYVGYVMYAGYEDFPAPEEFR